LSSFRNALAVYVLWVAATYFLEGLPSTLLRPEATGLRLAYALIANLSIGILLTSWLIRRHLRAGWGKPADYGFGSSRRRWVSIAVAAAVGYGLFRLGRPQPVDEIVLLNAFAQVFVVSAAEVAVCWSLVGATLTIALTSWKRGAVLLAAGTVASLFFGLYHFAHSPPFNELRMAAFLTGIGMVTSVFWIVSRDLVGTAVFHSFLGVTGVLAALEAGGELTEWAQPDLALLIMALIVAAALATGARPPARAP
jgi:hypothetical protein